MMEKPIKSTLCYIKSEGCYLMLYRNKKKNDLNEGKWLGIGGKLENGEHPDDGIRREVREETGLELETLTFHGVISFRSDSACPEEMFLYSAVPYTEGEPLPEIDCDEGEAKWIPESEVLKLNLWEGDRKFLEPLMAGEKSINLMLRYQGDSLVEVLDAPPGKYPIAPIIINERISYLPATDIPISSDVVLIRGDKRLYVFDSGSTIWDYEYLKNTDSDKVFIISHFHADHNWWLTPHRYEDGNMFKGDDVSENYEPLEYGRLLVSAYTEKHMKAGEIVSEPLIIEDGVKIEIRPFPSCHAKGCLTLIVDDEYAFVGDATYPCEKNGKKVYNAGQLKETIDFLNDIPADILGLSHDSKFLRSKKLVLRQLSAVYSKRVQGEPWIG